MPMYVVNFGDGLMRRRMYILLCLGEMFCKHVRSIWFVVMSVDSGISLFSFCLGDILIGESGVLKSPIECVQVIFRFKLQ